MMKTHDEILARIKEIEDKDWMGIARGDLIEYLPFHLAKPYLNDEITEEKWAIQTTNMQDPLTQAKSYLSFAWDKANDCRGLSAGRSLDHLSAWLWLAGHGELVDEHFDEYQYYGKEQLIMACTICGLRWQDFDNGCWINNEDDAQLHQKSIDDLAQRAIALAEQSIEKLNNSTSSTEPAP